MYYIEQTLRLFLKVFNQISVIVQTAIYDTFIILDKIILQTGFNFFE